MAAAIPYRVRCHPEFPQPEMVMPSSVTSMAPIFTTSVPSYQVAGMWPSQPVSAATALEMSPRYDMSQVQVVAPDRYVNAGVWPPPPLPPISCEITERIEALERQKLMSMEKEMESDVMVAEWKAKVELLEAKLRIEADALQRAQEAESRVRDELGLENDRLQRELRQAQALISELRADQERERASSQDDSQLRRQLEAMTAQRDSLAEDLTHLKKANAHREKEAITMREQLGIERRKTKFVETERDTANAEIAASQARASFEQDEQVRRKRSDSFRNSFSSNGQRRSFEGRRSFEETSVAVDLTSMEETDLRGTRITRTEIEIDEYSTGSDSS